MHWHCYDGSTFSCKTMLHHNVWCNTTQNLCDTLLNHSGLWGASHGSGLLSDHSEAIKCTWFWNVVSQRSSVAVCLQSGKNNCFTIHWAEHQPSFSESFRFLAAPIPSHGQREVARVLGDVSGSRRQRVSGRHRRPAGERGARAAGPLFWHSPVFSPNFI